MKLKKLGKSLLCLLLILSINTPMYIFADNILHQNINANHPKKASIKTYKYKNFKKIPTKISLKKKQSIKIQIKNINRKNIKFKSTNKKILSISKYNILKAKKKGICKLKVYIKKNKKWKIKKTISIYVGYLKKEHNKDLNNEKNTEKSEIDIKKIVIDNGNQTINVRVNKSIYLPIKIYPENATNTDINFKIDDTTIANIDKNMILSGYKLGQTTLSCYSKVNPNIKSSIIINVCKIDSAKKKVIAHRGYSSNAPENSIAAYKLACNYDFYGIECDVHKTKDGIFVLNHDANMKKTYGVNLKIAECTYDEIKDYKIINANNVEEYPNETIPTIEDYLEIIKNSDKVAVIELKGDLTYNDLLNLSIIIDSYNIDSRLEFISFKPNILKNMRNIYDSKDLYYKPNYTFLSISANIAQTGLDDYKPYEWAIKENMGFGCYSYLISEEIVEILHEHNLGCFVFEVDKFYTAYDLFYNLGIDAIASNTAEILDD